MKIQKTCGLLLLPLLCLAPACAPKAKWSVWTVTETRHVLRSEPPAMSPAAEIAAARNEWVSFQILVRADAPLKGVRVEPGDLAGPGGAAIRGTDVRLYREHQLHIERGTDRNAAFRPDWYPDPLIPAGQMRAEASARFVAEPFDLPAGETHAFWFDIFVPEGVPAGPYQGTCRVTATGARPAAILVNLTIFDFNLPTTPTLVTEFGSPVERLHRYYKERAAKGIEPEPHDWAAVEAQCSALLSENRLNAVPTADLLTPEARPDGSFVIARDKIDALRAFVDRYHVNGLKTPHPDTVVKDPVKESRRLRAWLAAFDRAAAELGRPQVVFYTYLKDEPNSLKDYQYVQKWGRAVREAKSAVKVLVVEQPWTEPGSWHADSAWGDLFGAVDIWCPLFSLHRPESSARRQALGETIWTYTALCQLEPTPWWQIDYPLLNYRVPAWMAWADGIKGLLYWGGLSYWAESDDPWSETPRFSEKAAARTDPRVPVFNGDGTLAYPGRPAGVEGLVPTIRLKALRDGIEDYEYLAMAERLGRGDEARRIARSLAPSFFEWNKDAVAYEKARADLAELIVKAGRRSS